MKDEDKPMKKPKYYEKARGSVSNRVHFNLLKKDGSKDNKQSSFKKRNTIAILKSPKKLTENNSPN
jgi:hypothetical protein